MSLNSYLAILGITHALRLPDDDNDWAAIANMLPSAKVLSFAVGVIHGLLSTRQLAGAAGMSHLTRLATGVEGHSCLCLQ